MWHVPVGLVPTAINFLPSADDAIEVQYSLGELFVSQLTPEFVVVKIKLGLGGKSFHSPAVSLVPSADKARQFNKELGVFIGAHVFPE